MTRPRIRPIIRVSPKNPNRFWMPSGVASSLLNPGIRSKTQSSGIASRPYGAEVPCGKEMSGSLKYFWTTGAVRSAIERMTARWMPAARMPSQ